MSFFLTSHLPGGLIPQLVGMTTCLVGVALSIRKSKPRGMDDPVGMEHSAHLHSLDEGNDYPPQSDSLQYHLIQTKSRANFKEALAPPHDRPDIAPRSSSRYVPPSAFGAITLLTIVQQRLSHFIVPFVYRQTLHRGLGEPKSKPTHGMCAYTQILTGRSETHSV
jgi:hypothetical protein